MSPEQNKHTDVLEKLATARCSNLTFYFDNDDFFNGIEPQEIDRILEAYHRTYWRFLKNVFLEERDYIYPNEFPDSNIVLTRSREVFKSLYHSPARFDMLPDWVRGYVNFNKSVYVWWVPEGEKVKGKDLNGSCHEFTHTVIPGIYGLPASYLQNAWPTWIHEGYTVGLNQLKPAEWTTNQLISPKAIIPSARSIEENGIFFHDQRHPSENPTYQYCYWLTNEVGKSIKDKLFSEFPKTTPLMAVGWLTQIAYRAGIPSLKAALDEQDIDMSQAEFKCRELLNITHKL